jgi:AcrR family transcriptional regulator
MKTVPDTAQASDDRSAVAEPLPRVGRPARIDRQRIAEAAHEVTRDAGLEGLTLKAVADRLGVTVAALYHHVAGKDDVLRLAADHAASRVRLPEDRGQHWALWLLEWAAYAREVFASEPALLGQYLDSDISVERIAVNTDLALGLLVRQGFSPTDARAAFELVSSCGLGTAINTIREERARRSGRPSIGQFEEVLAEHRDDELPALRAMVHETEQPGAAFWSGIVTVLVGIAVRRGEDWQPIVTMLDTASG